MIKWVSQFQNLSEQKIECLLETLNAWLLRYYQRKPQCKFEIICINKIGILTSEWQIIQHYHCDEYVMAKTFAPVPPHSTGNIQDSSHLQKTLNVILPNEQH